MLRPIPDMPAGTLGFEAVGELDDDDYGLVAHGGRTRRTVT
jgi:hypothetical protein